MRESCWWCCVDRVVTELLVDVVVVKIVVLVVMVLYMMVDMKVVVIYVVVAMELRLIVVICSFTSLVKYVNSRKTYKGKYSKGS